jgi:ubiquitin carboxyl-terminal hydrolase MINDY-1/2
VQSRPPPPIPTDLISLPSEESHAWDEEARPLSVPELPSDPQLLREKGEGHNIWEGNNARGKQQSSAFAAQQAAQEEYLRKEAGGWESELQLQENGTVFNIDDAPEHQPILPAIPSTEIEAPTLIPRLLEEETPPMKPQRHVDMANSNSLSNQDSSRGGSRQQRRETYEIKKVAWYDATASSNFRVSPILVQNANGPCPLLALVNALCLSTPAELNTALVETLRSREQVSLGLLLDAVFDELMSGRRGGAAQELPDVGDLYAFLVTLHTGMNVNPLFFPSSTSLKGDSSRPMSQAHLIEREDTLPGTFENTREMTLYSTWLAGCEGYTRLLCINKVCEVVRGRPELDVSRRRIGGKIAKGRA